MINKKNLLCLFIVIALFLGLIYIYNYNKSVTIIVTSEQEAIKTSYHIPFKKGLIKEMVFEKEGSNASYTYETLDGCVFFVGKESGFFSNKKYVIKIMAGKPQNFVVNSSPWNGEKEITAKKLNLKINGEPFIFK